MWNHALHSSLLIFTCYLPGEASTELGGNSHLGQAKATGLKHATSWLARAARHHAHLCV